ncbi:ABC transporter substrate-binding protein [Marinomonas pollencensis]|uniref:Iron complex transport system substrate-binding protein n=1 Tax=Marinomonas pollencensis TaxID=491954 RepID=A0A3E0DPT1_9GAMM|nr:iron-siderophore ABC transporter substrate-binding protein [Marinomonas pollencensis]REG84966.1 iron complex transport system substrate-binding protein [Marinomonas pollencensis]
MFTARSFRHAALLAAGLTAAMGAFAAGKVVSTQYGDVTVNSDAKRVVTLYEGALDISYALDVKPIGAITTRGSDGVSNYLGDRAKGIKIVGTTREINLEAVAAQRPDLILASPRLNPEQYKILSKIAPTIVPKSKPHQFPSWTDDTRLFGKALNKSQEAEAIIAKIHDREADIKKVVEAKIPQDKRNVSLIRWMPQGAMVMSTKIFSTEVLANTGFKVNDGGVVKKGSPHSSALSLENLSSIDSEWVFLATMNLEGQKSLDAAKKSPAFERLSVVKKDHVIPVDGQVWTSGSGPLAAMVILDNIQKTLDTKVSYPE